jgi:Right handed beta helix region
MRKFGVVVALATVWVVVFAGVAEARGRPVHTASPPPAVCPTPGAVVDVEASIHLTANYGCSLDVNGGTSTTPIVIDLGGHRLNGFVLDDDTPAPVVVRNGTVTGSVGPLSHAPDAGTTITIDHVHVMGDAGAELGGDLTITFSQIDGAVLVGGNNTAVRWSVLRGGISMDDSNNGLNVSITNNLLFGSPGDGIHLLDEFTRPDVAGTISWNIVARSAGSGIDLGDGSDLAGLVVSHNLISDNGGDGIVVGPSPFAIGGTVTVTGNIAIRNGGHGFNLRPTAPDKVVDGGHNLAFANRTAPQCVGVAC